MFLDFGVSRASFLRAWRGLGGSWGSLGSVLGRSGGVLGVSGERPGGVWEDLGGSGEVPEWFYIDFWPPCGTPEGPFGGHFWWILDHFFDLDFHIDSEVNFWVILERFLSDLRSLFHWFFDDFQDLWKAWKMTTLWWKSLIFEDFGPSLFLLVRCFFRHRFRRPFFIDFQLILRPSGHHLGTILV